MQDIIQLLPDSIANQIAAGEVVQRPASVVKELLENSIDAKATNIQLIVKEAGKQLIQVIDNGTGMSETDARMCFERHATSKIRTSDDLFKIMTMGFRGEAMASIAAVAQVELRTRREADEVGVSLAIEASDFKGQEAIVAPVGTNIQVKNLFYNVPARRNFLKSNPIEMRHIIDEFHRVALANSEIAFSLQHQNSEVYTLPSAKLSKRIVDIFGKQYREQLAPCEEETPYVRVRGYVGKPDSAKKTRTEQFFFVNNRFIKNSYLHHAVLSAFEGLIPEGTHPFYVIFIEIDPIHIDINVHPTKTEIKFDDERSVYGIVAAAVRKAMNAYNLSPSLDFESDGFFGNLDIANTRTDKPSSGSGFAPALRPPNEQRPSQSNWKSLYEGFDQTFVDRFERKAPEQTSLTFAQRDEFVTIQSKANRISQPAEADNTEASTFQIHNRYILSQVRSGMLLIDQRAAYERILFEKYSTALFQRKSTTQQLLFPKTIRLNGADAMLCLEILEEIRALGFDINQIGHDSFIINGIPTDLPDEDEQKMLEGILEQFKQNQNELKLDKLENLARSMAKRTSGRHNHSLTSLEMNALVEQLFASSNPSYTPSGEVTMRIISLEEMAELIRKK
jgi:DNA mismatch repair protein MutL